MAQVKSDGENDKTISNNREKVEKWLDSLPILFETESVAPEQDTEEPKCEIENIVTATTVDDIIFESAENIIMNDVDELLKQFDDNECYEMNITQSDDGKKCQNVLQLNVNEDSTDQPSVHIEGSIHNNLFYETEDQLVGESGKRKKRIGNKRKLNAINRVSGKSYKTRKGKLIDEKILLPNPCSEMKCQNKCGAIHDTFRKDIFDNFYALPSSQQKDFLVSCVVTHEKKRKYTENDISRRTCSKSYYLPIDREFTKVCQQFLISTLNITQRILTYTEENRNKTLNQSKTEGRGNHPPKNKTTPENLENVDNFIKNLPAVPSHYCRASSTRKYLLPEMKNLTNIFRIYKAQCEQKKIEYVKEQVFRNIFNTKFNIGIHTPKKDKCVTCEKMKNIPDENKTEEEKLKFQKHLKDAESSKNIHLEDQKKSKYDHSFLCTSFDLQKVLNTPHGNSMLLYYSRKYSIYNESFYESGTKNGYCFIWGEENGQRGANEICSVIVKYLTIVDERAEIKKVSLYCDSCPGQNKNHQTLSAIFWFILNKSKNIQEITITFLQPGHTYMPVDSVHATIESNLKNKIVWAPSEWPTIMVNARMNPKPYDVYTMSHNDFMDFKVLQHAIFPKIVLKNGKKFSEIKKVYFSKSRDVKISFGYELDAEFEIINVTAKRTKRKRNEIGVLMHAYNSKLPISEAKYKDLVKLCETNAIPPRYHQEYLSMSRKSTVRDALAETDDEDDTNLV
ncbi:hypothetical protein AGLY_003339 [Aphis glycines]|uniref:DUF7869 domain-containing protein n=1 Tax=Aphis glycines TaxID=307491 RepID=A0A6G0U039_APHGL|nr:hypothetical protein AGLY_003339 [Aphis glycines]